jgi:hypothetical protein
MGDVRSGPQRRADAVAKLEATRADVWVATASAGSAHLVPLSFAWNGTHVVLAAGATAVTTRNIVATGHARLAFGGTRDVVMVDADFEHVVAVGAAPPEIAETYAGQADWDPRSSGGDYVYLLLVPRRIQVWREENEIAGRTIMRGGAWLDDPDDR